MPTPLPPADSLNSALEQAAAVIEPLEGPARLYRPWEVARVLAVAAAVLLALDSDGLLTWTQRMELGPAQAGLQAVLSPINARLDAFGLTRPRRWLTGQADRLGHTLSVGEDPLIAGGWTAPGDEPVPELPVVREEPVEDEGPPIEIAVTPYGFTVLLLGDSMIAGSLGASISQGLARDSRLRVVHAFQTATGLSRPDIYDWMKVVPPLLERERPRLIVCSLGANDVTRIREGDRELDFGEPGWRTAYSARVVELMRRLTSGGARVLWLSLPPMRAERFSNHAQALNTIFAQAAKKVPNVDFLELRMLVSEGGEYATFVRGPDGRRVRYRLDDGVHYAPSGARAVTRWVVDWIYERYRKLAR